MSKNREELVNKVQLNLWRTIESWILNSSNLNSKVEELAEAIVCELELRGCDPVDVPEDEAMEELYADMDEFEGVL